MKKLAGKGAKLAATVLLSVMAMGYSLDASAEEYYLLRFVDLQGEQKRELYPSMGEYAPGTDVNFLYAKNVEQLKITSTEDDLKISAGAKGIPSAGSKVISSNNANIDFSVNGELGIESVAYLFHANDSAVITATGISGTNGGSTNINAGNVSVTATAYVSEKMNGTEKFYATGIDLKQHDMNIKTNGDVKISADTEGSHNAMVGGIVLNNANASIEAGGSLDISTAISKHKWSSDDTEDAEVYVDDEYKDEDELPPEKLLGAISGVVARNSDFAAYAQGKIDISSQVNDFLGDNSAVALFAYNSNINMQADDDITVSVNAPLGSNINGSAENVFAISANGQANVKLASKNNSVQLVGNVCVDNSSLELKAADEININGTVAVNNDSLLRLSGDTSISKPSIARSAASGDVVNITDSTLVIDGVTRINGNTTLNNAKVYFYDGQEQENAGPHVLVTRGSLNLVGLNNDVFIHADSSKISDIDNDAPNSDLIFASGVNGSGKLNVNIFDEGMKNGYADQDGFNAITIFACADNVEVDTLINKVNNLTYDNGIWKYAYSMEAQKDAANNIVINKVDVAAQASSSQLTMQAANRAAAANAVTVLGADNALHEHLGEVRESSVHEEVWAKYLGGKVKADGAQVKYNGVELGYDAYVGNDWTFGVSGMQVRGNTQLDRGNGKVRTNVGTVYGQWQGSSGEYLNLEAKAGRIKSESKALGVIGSETFGSSLQKIEGEFSAPAYSLSAIVGRKMELADDWFVEPMAKLSYVHMGAADYNVSINGTAAQVANAAFDSFALRGGFKLGRNLSQRGNFYVKAAALYDFAGDVATTIMADKRSARYEDNIGGWGVEYGAGIDYHLSKGSKLTFDVERVSGSNLKRDWGVNVGLSYSF